jgi:O-antigen ligase
MLIAALIGVTLHLSNFASILQQRLSLGNYASGVSARLSLYEIAWDNWKKNPLIGRGPGTSRMVIQQAGEEYNDVKRFDHLHNVLFDMASQIGIIGVAFVGISFFIIIRQALRSRGGETDDWDYIVFAMSALGIMLITGIVNQPFHSPHGVYLAGFLGGICYSFKFGKLAANPLPIPCLHTVTT